MAEALLAAFSFHNDLSCWEDLSVALYLLHLSNGKFRTPMILECLFFFQDKALKNEHVVFMFFSKNILLEILYLVIWIAQTHPLLVVHICNDDSGKNRKVL